MMWIEKIEELYDLLDDNDRRTDNIVNYYNTGDNHKYIPHIVQSLKILDSTHSYPDYAFNLIKTTRAGCTTNTLMSALMRDKKILLVEPTNAILYETVREILGLYEMITGDKSKIVRQIPSNRDGCSQVVSKVHDNEKLDMIPYILAGDCEECTGFRSFPLNKTWIPKADLQCCTVQTLMDEKELYGNHWLPDIVTITYDKLLTLGIGKKSEFFSDMIENVDIILFDEVGAFVSRIENGIQIHEERAFGTMISDSGIEDMKQKLWNFIMSIQSPNLKKRMILLANDYIIPFINDTCNPIPYEKEFPRYVQNTLANELIQIKRNFGNIKKNVHVTKTEGIKEKASEFYDDLESMIGFVNKEQQETILWLINILQIMQHETFVAYRHEGIEFTGAEEEHDEKITVTNIVPLVDETLKRLERWLGDKVVLFTDATMPAFSFEKFGRPIIDVFFGDPANTNAELMVMNDRSLSTFSVTRWNKNPEFKKGVVDIIEKVAWDYGTDIVVWCPNKKVWKQMIKSLNDRDISTCTHEDDDGFSILVTYYGSPMTRGVRSDRRIQVLLGKANKPKDSYKHVAYMQRIQWDTFTDRELDAMAKNSGVTVEEFKYGIEKWVREYNIGDRVVRSNKIPDEIRQYFDYYAQSIQDERTYMDTWQAGSRAKDSLARTRSVLLCIGWKNNEVWDMLKWGSNASINYVPYYGDIQRTVQRQQSIIAPPKVVEIKSYDEIKSWINDGELNSQFIGFDVDFQTGVYNMLIHGREHVESEEVWMELSRNMGIGETKETCMNGYLIGSIRAFQLFNDFGKDIECEEFVEGQFRFKLTETPKPDYTPSILYDDLTVITKLLKFTFLHEKEKLSYRDIRQGIKKSISDEMIRRALNLIYSNNLFEGSTWDITVSNHKGRNVIKIRKNAKTIDPIDEIRKSTIDDKFKFDFIKRNIMKEIIEWCNNETTMQLTPRNISDRIQGTTPKLIQTNLEEMFENKKEIMNLNCMYLKAESEKRSRVMIVRTIIKP